MLTILDDYSVIHSNILCIIQTTTVLLISFPSCWIVQFPGV